MRIPITAFTLMLATHLSAQVVIDRPVQFTGAPSDRVIIGLAPPLTASAAITVEASLAGKAHWAQATLEGSSVALTPSLPSSDVRDGQLLRFIAPAELYDSLTLACTGQPTFPLLRPDGARIARGQVHSGTLCEVVHMNSTWVLMNAPEHGCPPGTVSVNDRLCVEIAGAENMTYYPANDRCVGMGGQLCTWGEFYLACTSVGTQLTGSLGAWEWLDDSSNHAHSAVQAGMTACTAQRWGNPVNPIFQARSRCCFVPR